jgi:hypothetical protein
VKAHPVTWLLRALWLVLPFTTGDALGAALSSRSTPVQHTVATGAWVLWALLAVALVVPHAVTLTTIRLGVPGAVVVAGWAAWRSDATAAAVAGLVVAVVASGLVLSGFVADDYVDGSSYGDERRFALRAPGPLLLGPIPLAWAVTVAGIISGPLWLACECWIRGVVGTAVGWALAALAWRAIHTLSKRFVVFVPAGMTLVDPSTLIDAILFPRRSVMALGPAPADGDGLDLSQQALGLALQVTLNEPFGMTLRRGRNASEEAEAVRVVFTPARPGAVVAEAARRRLTSG